MWDSLSKGPYTLEDEEAPEETLADDQDLSLDRTVNSFLKMSCHRNFDCFIP